MVKIFQLISLFIIFLSLNVGRMEAQNIVFTNAKTEKVQVYFNGAEIQQKADATLPKGASEVVITNIANLLDENTVQIKSTKNITILSVQFSNQEIAGYNKEYISEATRPIWDSIQVVEKQIAKNNILKNSLVKSVELLDKNQQLSGQTTHVSELSKLLEYYKNKRVELETQLKGTEKSTEELQKKLSELKFRMGTASSQNTNNRGKLILQVMNDAVGKVPFQVNYVTHQARWSPFYEIRSEQINTPIILKYNAAVNQNTGVDWNDVKLSLSSGYINERTQIPNLNTWFIDYQNQPSAQPVLRRQAAFKKNMETQELVASEATYDVAELEDVGLNEAVAIGETQLNVVFDIDLPYTILSNGKKHSVFLKKMDIPAQYKYYAVPKYDSNAYLVSDVQNYGAYNLLSGEANLVFEQMYVGKTYINTQNNEKLILSLGKDKKINISRKLVSQNTENKSFSSRKVQTFTYEISVTNTKKEAIEIELEDQIPVSTNKDIKVNLTASDNASLTKENGKLKWLIALKPNENKKIRFTYEVEFNKDMNVRM